MTTLPLKTSQMTSFADKEVFFCKFSGKRDTPALGLAHSASPFQTS